MNWYYVLYQTVLAVLLVLLFLVPFAYCLRKHDFKDGFWFTWIIWSIVWFVFGTFSPAFTRLREKATGEETTEIMCGTLAVGLVMGWLPGLIFASLGWFFRKMFMYFSRKRTLI